MHAGLRRIVTGREEESVDMLTGETVQRRHPLTGELEPWSFIRTYGCGSQNVSEYFVKFRSGAAGFTDLARDAGTSNISGFRAGCTNNLIVADGVFNAPDYTRSCSCSYQQQTSLGLVHMPEVEMWTYTTLSTPEPGTVRQAALNFGAPGCHLAEDGMFWLDYPRAGGPAPEIPVVITPDAPGRLYRKHSTRVEPGEDAPAWVAASGIEGARAISIGGLAPLTANPGRPATYRVRLHFAEPAGLAAGERQFDVRLQGETVLPAFDAAAAANGPGRAIGVTFEGVPLDAEHMLHIELVPLASSKHGTVISGIEMRIEE
jgi:hypothetical protein